MDPLTLLPPLLALALAPLLPGVSQRVQAFAAGRHGPSVFQLYYDIWKNLKKGSVYSSATTWLFRAGPVAGLAAVAAALAIVPLGGIPALLAFPGDLFLFAVLLGVARLATVLAALDTGSSFEGMGASREVQFSALAEPAFLLGLSAIARAAGGLSLSDIENNISHVLWSQAAPAFALAAASLFVVLLTENCRIPVDDPATHLELTMIHEVMVLDHGSVDFAFIQYGAALKFWAFGALWVGVVVPVHSAVLWVDLLAALAGMFLMAVVVGAVASSMARLRLNAVPRMLVAAGALSTLALVFVTVPATR
jgi:formate hydrogenlyase subunit 4